MQIVNCSGLWYNIGYVQQPTDIYNKDLVYEYVHTLILVLIIVRVCVMCVFARVCVCVRVSVC